MTLQEIIDIKDGRKRLTEMAFPIKQVRDELMNNELRVKRFYHLILIYYFRNEQETQHWISEMTGLVPKSPLIKGSNRRFNELETFHLIWKGWVEDDIPDKTHSIALSNAKEAEETKRRIEEQKTGQRIPPLPWNSIKQNSEDAFLFMEEFHQWAAKCLSKEGEVFAIETRQSIYGLLEKHSFRV